LTIYTFNTMLLFSKNSKLQGLYNTALLSTKGDKLLTRHLTIMPTRTRTLNFKLQTSNNSMLNIYEFITLIAWNKLYISTLQILQYQQFY